MKPVESRSRRVTQNTLFLYGSEVASRLFSWALLFFLTHHWMEVGTYGQYAVAVNWVSILSVCSELGLNAFVVREVAHRKELAQYYLRNSIAIRMAFSVFFWLGLVGVSFALNYEPVLKWAIAVIAIRIILDSVASGYFYLFQSFEMMGYYSLVNIWGSLIRLVGIVAVVMLGGGVIAACSIWTVSSLLGLVALIWKGEKLGWRPDFSLLRWNEAIATLKSALPFATFGAFQTLYYRIDSVILKSLSGNEAVGYYDLSAKILFVVLAFSQIFGTAVFPALSAVRDYVQTFRRMTVKAIKFLLLLGLPITVGGWLLAKPIVLLVAGNKYLLAAPMFAILMLSVVPYFLSHVYCFVLGIYDTFRLNLQFAVLFLLNAALNFILIPHWGGIGSAWATVFCEFFGIFLGFGMASPYLRHLPWGSLSRPFFACLGASAIMGAGIYWDPRLYWLVLGPPVYCGAFWLLRGLEKDDLDSIRSILRIRKR
jgi:O-antigen/teichoic acid export membrane protein